MKFNVRTPKWLIIAYVIAILILSIAPTNSNKHVDLSSTSILHIRSDYLLHALLFVPWMILIRFRCKKKKGIGFFIKTLAMGLLLAAVSEGVQFVLPYRSFNVVDLEANWLWVVIGAFISGWERSKIVVSSQ